MKIITRKMLATTLTLAMVAPLAVACTKGEKTDDKQERVLKIATSMMYGGDDEYFRQQFTEII